MNHKRAAIAILGAEVAMAASFALAGITGLSGHAQADTGTINLSEIHRIDLFPVCAEEDGSGSELPCIWTNDGNAWLTYADHSLLIVDDTVTP